MSRKPQCPGFTLIEVIVVAIIVAALAAIAIGVYVSYVNSSHRNAAANACGAMASFCSACVSSAGTITNGAIAGGGGILSCTNGVTMNIPSDIEVTGISNLTGSGQVTAKHKSEGTIQTYAY